MMVGCCIDALPRLSTPIWARTKEKTINAVNTELLQTSWQTGGFHFQKVRHVSHIDVEPLFSDTQM